MKLAIEESDIAVVWRFFAKDVDLNIYIYIGYLWIMILIICWIFKNNTMWGPRSIAKLVNVKLWFMILTAIVNGVHKPTYNCGGPHCRNEWKWIEWYKGKLMDMNGTSLIFLGKPMDTEWANMILMAIISRFTWLLVQICRIPVQTNAIILLHHNGFPTLGFNLPTR